MDQPATKEQWDAIKPTTLTILYVCLVIIHNPRTAKPVGLFSHSPNDTTSVMILRALHEARAHFPRLGKYPPPSWAGPLKLELDVHERPPSEDDFRRLVSIQPAPSFRTFLHPEVRLKHALTSAAQLAEIVAEEPALLLWPIIADWDHRELSIGGNSYTKLVQRIGLRRRAVMRGGAVPPPQPKREPPAEEWIDYD